MKKIRMNKFISLFLSAIMILTIFPSYALAEASDAFEVTFFGWGNSVLKTQQVNAGENATPPESVPTPDGKQFTGWTGNYKNVNQNESVYAQFSDVYTVTFLGGADKTSVLKTEVVLSGGSATAPSDKGIPAGERFVGWDVAFNNVTKDLVVTAQYAPLRDYTVTFLGGADGKTVLGTENVKEFQSAKEPADKGIPDPDTQIFDGWDSEAYLSVTGDELNIVIHAVYAPIEGARIMSFGLLAPTTQQYTVTYTSGGATGTPPASQTVDTGTVLSVPTPTGLTPPNSDPVFYYWKDTATNETYKLGSAITVTKNTSLVAVWGKGWQLNLNVGSGGSAYLVTITAPVYPVITPNQLYPTYQDITIKAVPNIGWTLKGFFKNNGGAGEFTNYVYEGNGIYSLTISASSNTNMVYVKFEQPWFFDLHEVNYVRNYGFGGTGSAPNDSNDYAEHNMVTVLGQNTMNWPGHQFLGWSLTWWASSPDYSPGSTFDMPDHNVTLYGVWRDSTYTVTYDANNGSGSTTTDPNLANNSTYTVKNNSFTAPTGKHFTGWNTQANGSGTGYAAGATFTITGNVTLYAQWAYDTFTVSYDANTGTGSMSSDLNQPYNSTYATKSNGFTAPANKHFTGWNTQANGSGTGYAAGATFTITGNVTLYAQWAYDTFTVSYDANTGTGSMSSDLNQPYNSTYATKSNGFTAPANKHFTGWNTQANGSGTGYAAGAIFTITGNVTLYAQWTFDDQYDVLYDANGGSATVPTDGASYFADDTVTALFSPAPTRSGFNFLGWATTSDATTATYTEGGTESFTMGASDVTLYAVWDPIEYAVSYNANGGIGPVPTDSTIYYMHDTATVLFTPAPTRSGYNFLGWATTSDATTATYTEGGTESFTMGVNDVTLYAVWEAIDYSVTYDANGGIGPVPTDSALYHIEDTVTVLFTPAPTRLGFNFVGWSTNIEAATPMYATSGTTTFEMGASDVTLYAVWDPIEYAVSYDANGGIGPVPTDSTIYYMDDTATVLFAPAPTRNGYTFKGWATASDATTPTYTTGGTTTFVMGTTDVTLYAVWELIEYKITYVMGGGTNVLTNPTTYTVESPLITLEAPARAGYNFLAWTPGNTIPAGSTGDKTVTATWSAPIIYPITYVMNGGVNAAANPATYTIESPAIALAAPVQAGYVFLGWTPVGGIPVGSIGPRVFTANWSAPIIYNITYVMNGGTNAPGNPATYTVESPLITLDDPTRTGYDFLGWTQTDNIPAGSVGDVTFTATWSQPHVHTVTYYVNGGTATGLDGAEPYIVYSNVAYGTVVPVPVNPDQAEFTFDGWTTAIPVNMPDEDVVIYGSMTRLPVLQEIITNERTPLAGPTWALMNLILAIVTALATASIFTLLKKNREVEPTKRRKVFRWSTLIPAAGAIVAFLLTENMSNSMVLTDRWTLLMLGIAAVQILVVVLGFQKNKQNA